MAAPPDKVNGLSGDATFKGRRIGLSHLDDGLHAPDPRPVGQHENVPDEVLVAVRALQEVRP